MDKKTKMKLLREGENAKVRRKAPQAIDGYDSLSE